MMRRSIAVSLALVLIGVLVACEGNRREPAEEPMSAGAWTWIAGGDTINQHGIYGSKGRSDPANVPGSRSDAVSWMDAEGGLWLFGGHGVDSGFGFGMLSDLWKYDTASGEWTWVSGSDLVNQSGIYGVRGAADPLNVPGARHPAASWLDKQGNLWLFGGSGPDGADNWGQLNDLWRFEPASGEWTWVGGSNAGNQVGVYGVRGVPDPSNGPGSKAFVSTWVDASGKFWLFGGFGFVSAGNLDYFNDLWSYDPAANLWTWVSGSDTDSQPGAYGVLRTADPANIPGARGGAASWIGSNGGLWLFGGEGIDSAGNFGLLNDLWRYDPGTGEWTWMDGSCRHSQRGDYGVRGVTSEANVPGSRQEAISWVDADGHLWLFGGNGHDADGYVGWLNDIWMFDPVASEWAWISGSTTIGQNGIYSAGGSAGLVPGARRDAVAGLDARGRLWLFGGASYDSLGTQGGINDFWRYTR